MRERLEYRLGRILLVTGVLTLSLFLSGAFAAPQPTPGGTLTHALPLICADTLNQHLSNNTPCRMVARHVLDGLVAINPVDGTVQPWLAESWETSGGGRIYLFRLRRGVRFHDGTPFDAEAVRFNFEWTMSPDRPRRGFRYAGMGGSNYVRAEVVNEFTVRVIFKEPYGGFLTYLSDGGLGIDSPSALRRLGDQYGSRELVGTGPFKLVEWVSGSRAVLERNPDYAWATKAYAHTGPTRLERLIYAQIPEAATRAAALEKGDVSTAQITPPDLAALRGKPGIRIVLLPQPGTSRMILFNTAKGPTADIRVRRAINHAINKSILIRLPAWSGTGSPAFAALGRNLVPKESLPEYDRLKEEDYAYDVERAKQLLDEAGWKPGPDGVRVKDGQRLVIDNVVFEGFVGEMQAFQAMLRQVGIDFRIRGGDGSFLIATNTRGDFNTTLVGDSGYDAAGQLSEFFRSGAIYNWLGFRSSELDRLIDAASATSDIGERWKNLIAAMRIINRNALGVMAWEASYVFAVRESVQNLAFHEIGFPYFYPAWIRPER